VSSSEADLTLLYKARDLTAGAVSSVVAGAGKIGEAGKTAAGKFAGAFSGLGGALANGIGNATETLSSGGSVPAAMAGLGIYMAGQLAETWAGTLLERLASSSVLAALAAPIAGMGTAIGGFLAAAIPIGMAALPLILIAAIGAAIVVLIVNPDIRNKVFDFVGSLIGHIGDALGALAGFLGQLIPAAFNAAFNLVVEGLKLYMATMVALFVTLPQKLVGLGASIMQTIVGGLLGLPGRIAQIIGDAFRNLHIDIGPFHISGSGVTIDLPKIDVPGFARGVTDFAGGLAVVGEQGPELVRLPRGSDVIPNDRTRTRSTQDSASFRIVGVTRRDLEDIADRALYVRLQRAGTGR